MWIRILIISFFLVSCRSFRDRQDMTQPDWNPATKISFDAEDASITQEAKDELSALYEQSAHRGKIEKIKIISWGDIDYPSIYSKKDADRQEELVIERNTGLLNYLEELTMNEANMQFSNMAERKSSLQEIMSQENDSTRKSLAMLGIPNTETTVKVPGMASKSIVIFVMEE